MLPNTFDSSNLGRYMALSQVGLEMVAPIVVGLLLDRWLEWGPWGLIGGAVLGLIAGLFRLVNLAAKQKESKDNQPDPSGPDET